jgi:hypothetical protein
MTDPTSPGVPLAERLEQDAVLAGEAAVGGLGALEVAAVVLVGLLVVPPLSAPYLLVHHFRGEHRGHLPLLGHRLRHAGRALVDLAPHRIVADARRPPNRRD